MQYSRPRLLLICFGIVANALCAGYIYCFPLIAPALVEHMKLTQIHLSTIAVVAMAGQYPAAAVIGWILDRYGSWTCSLIAAVLFSTGFGLVSHEVSVAPDEVTEPSEAAFRRLVLYFFTAGLGTAFSYFSLVFAATKTFPRFMGVASGISMSLFGLSPLFISILAKTFFTDPDTGLNIAQFFAFMAILTGTVHLLSALVFPPPVADAKPVIIDNEEREPNVAQDGADDENTLEEDPLLAPNKSTPEVRVVAVPEPQVGTVLDLLKDPYFWMLAVSLSILLGSVEMVSANMGSIVMSLPVTSKSDNIATQVSLFSICNTVSRLTMGPLADLVSPLPSYLPNGIWSFTRKHRASRMLFLTATCCLLLLIYLWCVVGIRSQEALWPLSAGSGFVYGATFTLLPSIISSIWGIVNLARNFGVVSYAVFIGTPAFSYLYAGVAAYHAPRGEVCKGVQCWQLTFGICLAAVALSTSLSLVLWRKWRKRV